MLQGPAGGGVRDLPRAGRAGGGAHGALRPGAAPRRGEAAADVTKVESIFTGLGASSARHRAHGADSPRSSCAATPTCSSTTSPTRTCRCKPIDTGGTPTAYTRRPGGDRGDGRRAAPRRGAQARAELQGARARAERRRDRPGLNAAARQQHRRRRASPSSTAATPPTLGHETTAIVVPDTTDRVADSGAPTSPRRSRCPATAVVVGHDGPERGRRHRRARRRLQAHAS